MWRCFPAVVAEERARAVAQQLVLLLAVFRGVARILHKGCRDYS